LHAGNELVQSVKFKHAAIWVSLCDYNAALFILILKATIRENRYFCTLLSKATKHYERPD
jgi:hypothetical protein